MIDIFTAAADEFCPWRCVWCQVEMTHWLVVWKNRSTTFPTLQQCLLRCGNLSTKNRCVYTLSFLCDRNILPWRWSQYLPSRSWHPYHNAWRHKSESNNKL